MKVYLVEFETFCHTMTMDPNKEVCKRQVLVIAGTLKDVAAKYAIDATSIIEIPMELDVLASKNEMFG